MNYRNNFRWLFHVRSIAFLWVMSISVISLGCSAGSGSAELAETFLKVAAGYTVLLFLLAFGGVVLWKTVVRNEIGTLLEEHGGGASMSRFQFLIFTFVVAFGIVFLLAKNNQFPDVPADVLTLIGISASTYAVSKGIVASSPDLQAKGVPPPPVPGENADHIDVH